MGTRIAFASMCVALAACDGVRTSPGGGSGRAGGSVRDAGSGGVDGGGASVDGGGASVDGGRASVDAGGSSVDGGGGGRDAGAPRPDAGFPPMDAGPSPGAYNVALASASSVEILRVAPGNATPVQQIATAGPWWPAWSPDGTSIAITGTDPGYGGDIEVQLFRAGASTPFRRFAGVAQPEWAPNARVVSVNRSQFSVLDPSSGQAIDFPEGGALIPRWDASGADRVAYLSGAASSGPRLMVRGLPGGTFAVGEGQTGAFDWAPSGAQIAYTDSDPGYSGACSLRIATLSGDRVASRSTLATRIQCGGAVDWAPAGNRIALAQPPDRSTYSVDGRIYLFSPTDAPIPLAQAQPAVSTGRVTDLHWTPDGRYLGYLASDLSYYGMQTELYLLPAGGGAPLFVTPAQDHIFLRFSPR